ADYNLKIKRADLEVKQVPAKIHFKQPKANLEIDYGPFLASLGFGGLESFMNIKRQEALQSFNLNLERTVSEGKALGAIEKDISIGEVAEQAATPQEKELQIVPLDSIAINVETIPLHWEAEQGGVEFAAQWGSIKITDFVFPSVRVYLEQEPYLKIEAVGQVIDLQK
ncbi:MAG TPA: hypothetical protein GXZ75_05320, partial [Clostridia bacterium]|nr:hypothetical protein [Clostridia bacterium]